MHAAGVRGDEEPTHPFWLPGEAGELLSESCTQKDPVDTWLPLNKD